MTAIENYLSSEDFRALIPGIPQAFAVTELQAYWAQLTEAGGWLSDLVPATNPFWTVTPPVNTEVLAALKVFAVYAIWSEVVLEGDVRFTKSGLVKKENSTSEFIDKDLRTELYRKYRTRATKASTTLSTLITPIVSCEVRTANRGVRIFGVKPDSNSYF